MRQAGRLQTVRRSRSENSGASDPYVGIGVSTGTRRVVAFGFFALTTWRATHLLVEEDGPADVVLRVRRFAGSGLLGQLMDCFYCASLWVALPLAVELTRESSPNAPWWRGGTSHRLITPERVATWFALSGAACLLERATESGDTSAPPDAPAVPHHEWTVVAADRHLVAERVA
jgi:hypothetical protein